MLRAVIFDMDDTLLVDEAWVKEAMRRVCGEDVAAALRQEARALWGTGPHVAYCRRIGISSWEGLVTEHPGPDDEARTLASWLPGYRKRAWTAALGGADGWRERAERYVQVRRSRYELFAGAETLLGDLRDRGLGLAVITNGPSDLQNEKLDRTGLRRLVDVAVVSCDVGIGKPDPAIFGRVLAELGCAPSEVVMVGDSLERDVAGAAATGMTSLWIGDPSRLPEGVAPGLVAPGLVAPGLVAPGLVAPDLAAVRSTLLDIAAR